MRLTHLLYASTVMLAAVAFAEDNKTEKKVKKLQIGVKKRIDPDQCKLKSKKGDTLHMHYTVSIIIHCSRSYYAYFKKIY